MSNRINLLSWIKDWLAERAARRKWIWVGIVEGQSRYKSDAGYIYLNTYWTLYERGDGKRRYTTKGDKYSRSPSVEFKHAEVDVWVRGGPLPELFKAPAKQEPPKKKAELVVFPGGGNAA